MKLLLLPVALLLSLGPLALAQESVRELERTGAHTKHLTIDTVDRWLLDGQADEVLRVDVRSGDFDPVLQLVRIDESGRITEVLVSEVDDPGAESHMLMRLPSGGRMAILVHGPGQRGGGSYRLYVERLRSEPLPPGAEFLAGTLDADGNTHVRVTANEGDMLVPRGKGVSEVIDPMGFSLGSWQGCYEASRSGEHYLRVRGEPGAPYRVGLAPVRRRPVQPDADLEDTVLGSGLDEWTFTTQENGFLVFELEGSGLDMRVVRHGEEPERALDGGPTHRWLPSHSKGRIRRMILVTATPLTRKVMIRSLIDRPAPYKLTLRDTSQPLTADSAHSGALALGGSDYWTFQVEPGEVLRLDADSLSFDPLLRLFDQSGAARGEFDDAGGGLNASHTWLVRRSGFMRAQVQSYGNGGGGEYQLRLTRISIPTIRIGEKRVVTRLEGGVEYLHLEGTANRDLLILTGSEELDTGLTLYGPDGIELASSWSSGINRGSLLSVRLPREGRYTLAVTGRGGGGGYTLRVLDPHE